MPSDESSALPESTSKERAALGRYLFDKLSHYFHPRTLPGANHVFDDALTAFIMTSISPSEQSVESSLHYWLAFLKFIVQELQLYKDSPILSEDDREERRRYCIFYSVCRTRLLIFPGYGGRHISSIDMWHYHLMNGRTYRIKNASCFPLHPLMQSGFCQVHY